MGVRLASCGFVSFSMLGKSSRERGKRLQWDLKISLNEKTKESNLILTLYITTKS